MVRRGDVLLALGVALVSCLVVALKDQVPPAPTVSLAPPGEEALGLLMALQGLALLWWRKYPLLSQGIIFLLQLPLLGLSSDDLTGPGIAQLLISYSLGRHLPLLQATALLTGLSILTVTIAVVVQQPDWPVIIALTISHALLFLAPMLVGAMLASWRRHEQALQRLEAKKQEQRLATTLMEERRRLASELHDVAAHHLAGLVVQAAALEQLIDRDPVRAKDAARQLRGLGKEALAGLRSVVKLLRHDDPQRGIRDIPELIESTRALGVPITAHLAHPPSLPPLSGTAAYRIIQQAISNAIQHAPGAAIHVEITPDGLTVRNGRGQGEVGLGSGGVGLEVMQERAAAIGAEFRAGPTDAGGWQVQLTWPHPIEEES